MSSIIEKLNKNPLVFLIFFLGSIASILGLMYYLKDKGKELDNYEKNELIEQTKRYFILIEEADNEVARIPVNYSDALILYKKAYGVGRVYPEIDLSHALSGIKLCELNLKRDNPNTDETFEEFENRFISDMNFQIERIKFPLEKGSGYFSMDGEENITKENWGHFKYKHSEIPVKFPELKIDSKRYENFVEEYWYKDESGFSGKYRYRKINGKWYLVYREDNSF